MGQPRSDMEPTLNKRKLALRSLRQHGSRARAAAAKVNITLGDLIAAAFDTVGNEVKSVAALISSADMSRAIGKRIVVT